MTGSRPVRDQQLELFERGCSEGSSRLEPPAAAEPPLPDLPPLFERLNRRFFEDRLEARCEWSERLVASAGNCRPAEGLIRVSAPYHRRTPAVLPITLAHEMCHLVVPGHGATFRRLGEPIARALGAEWRQFRYADPWADLRRHRYLYRCPTCGAEMATRKRLQRVSCGRCGPHGYSEDHALACVESRARPGPVLLGQRPVRTD
jgi:predicted SprT family Zn-dependent metalloprotease